MTSLRKHPETHTHTPSASPLDYCCKSAAETHAQSPAYPPAQRVLLNEPADPANAHALHVALDGLPRQLQDRRTCAGLSFNRTYPYKQSQCQQHSPTPSSTLSNAQCYHVGAAEERLHEAAREVHEARAQGRERRREKGTASRHLYWLALAVVRERRRWCRPSSSCADACAADCRVRRVQVDFAMMPY